MMSSTHPAIWWKSRSVILAIGLHVFLILFLFQGFSPTEWDHIKKTAKASPSGSRAQAIMEEHGPLGFISFYYKYHWTSKVYYAYAKLTLHGEVDYWKEKKSFNINSERPLPYRDIPIEYQPGALAIVSIPALIASNFEEYRFWLSAWFGFLYLFNIFLGIHLVTRWAPSTVQMKRMLWWSLAFLLLMGSIVTARFDHIVVTFVLMSTLVFTHALQQSGKRSLYWHIFFGFIVSVGVLTKIVPGLVMIVTLLILLVMHKKSPLWSETIAGMAGLVIGLIFLNAGFYLIFGPNYFKSFTYHMERGIQIETVYSGILLLAEMGGSLVTLDRSYGSANVASSLTDAIKFISPLLFAVIAVILTRRLWNNRSLDRNGSDAGNFVSNQFVLLTMILLLAFMLTNKVFSPQFLIWVGPLMAVLVAVNKNLWKISGIFLLATLLTQLMYPHLHPLLRDFHPAMVILLNVRNGLLIVILFLLIRELPKLISKNPSS